MSVELIEKLEQQKSRSIPPDRPLFVHSYLDEAGLDPYEFRAYSHIVRRVGSRYDQDFFASLKKSAQICGMSVRRLQYSLQLLCEAGFIEKQSRDGRTDIYKMCKPEKWASPELIASIRQQVKGSSKKNLTHSDE